MLPSHLCRFGVGNLPTLCKKVLYRGLSQFVDLSRPNISRRAARDYLQSWTLDVPLLDLERLITDQCPCGCLFHCDLMDVQGGVVVWHFVFGCFGCLPTSPVEAACYELCFMLPHRAHVHHSLSMKFPQLWQDQPIGFRGSCDIVASRDMSDFTAFWALLSLMELGLA